VSSYKKMNVFSGADPVILSGQKTSIILNINDIRCSAKVEKPANVQQPFVLVLMRIFNLKIINVY